MSDDFSTKGSIELDVVVKGVDAASRQLAKYNEETGFSNKAAVAAEKSMNRTSAALGGTAAATARATASTKAATAATDAHTTSMISQRYALYDVATTYTAISAALLAASFYAVKVAADFESAFTAVQRTSQGTAAQVGELRDSLLDMSTQVPLTFQELSQIAALGNQLGIAAEDVEGFTSTVARFAAISGVSIDSVADAFGKIANLTGLDPAKFENLGAAIAYVARTSAATEATILSTSKEISALADGAGFSADAIVGLSGALSSLSIAPEKARGALSIYFSTLNAAVAEGGQKLQNFATITGITADRLNDLVRNGQGQEVFQAFIQGLSQLDNVAKTTALDELGLSAVRVDQTFRALSGNTALVADSFAGASDAFDKGTELASQYALVVDDLNSRWMTFVNSINALVQAFSGGLVPGLGGALQKFTDLANTLRALAENPIVRFVAGLTIALSTLIGVLFAYKAAMALATATTFALKTATDGLAASGTAVGIRGLITQILGIGTASGVAASKVTILKTAIKSIGKATLILALVDMLYQLIFAWDELESTLSGASMFSETDDALKKVGTRLVEVAGVTVGVQNGMLRIGDAAFSAADAALIAFAPVIALFRLLSGGFSVGKKGHGSVGKDVKADLQAAAAAANEFGDALGGGVGGGAAEASREVRTLVDYANDLGQVFKRAFEIRFSGGQGLDAISTGWFTIRNAIDAVNQEISEYQATMMSLTADRAVKEYWLSVAENYGDALRAGQLRAELATIDTQLAQTSKDLAKAQDKGSKSLVGNTEGAIANRAEILGLVTDYQSYIQALAASGLSQDELRAKTAQLKADFLAQATQLGYNSDELGMYAAAFDDVTIAINNVPREITVDANMNPAIQALNEYLAQVNASHASPSIGGGGGAAGVADANAYAEALNATLRAKGDLFKISFGGPGGAVGPLGAVKAYGTGGYTGDIPAGAPAGVVHGKEFVFSAPAVKAIGVENLAYQHNMAKKGKSVGSGGGGKASTGMGGPNVVALSAYDRQLLIDNTNAVRAGLSIPGRALAGVVGSENVNSSTRRDS